MLSKALKEHKHLATWIASIAAIIIAIIAFATYRIGADRPPISPSINEPALEGIASFHFVHYPQSIRDVLQTSGFLRIIEEKIVIPEDLATLDDDQKNSLIQTIGHYINQEMGGVIGRYGLAEIDGYMSILIKNLTTRTLEDVTLKIPFFFKFAEIHRDGSRSEDISKFGDQIEFGELKPEETISVIAWLDRYPSGVFGQMKLLHRNGVGPVYTAKLTVDRNEDE